MAWIIMKQLTSFTVGNSIAVGGLDADVDAVNIGVGVQHEGHALALCQIDLIVGAIADQNILCQPLWTWRIGYG